ncbi:MAG: UPF0182 family protein [Deltaproteobacteria bacterium]|nr:UPF0182 family protein [Deltaproteobacteria bacterium]
MRNKIILGALGLLLIVVIGTVISVYPEWLWFKNLNFEPVFWTILLTKFSFGVIIWLLLILILALNVYVAHRNSPPYSPEQGAKGEQGYFSQIGISSNTLNIFLMAFVLIASFYIASKGSAQWDMVLRYLHQKPFGETDPIFNKDIGFYVFSLPFYVFIRNGLMLLFLFAGLLTIVWYLKDGAMQVIDELVQAEGRPPSFPKVSISSSAKKHLLFLAGILVVLMAWGYYLKAYGILYSTQGPAFGASYTDVKVKLPAYRVLVFFCLGFAVVLFMNAVRFRWKRLWLSGAIWLGGIIVLSNLLPLMIQKFIVKPNEMAKESPYIAYNIEYTRKAYGLDKVVTVDFPVKDTLSAEDLVGQDVTIENIRVWDERPLLQTYRQIQSIRLYYDFNNVDVDRYRLNGRYRQVMLAARELIVNQLPPQAKTWVNRHLTYTHGYGLAMSPVNEVTKEGLPRLIVRDLPPISEVDLEIERPEIYYGERTEQYVLVKTKAKEFDYPKGDENVYTTYEGKGGVTIRSFFRRLLFAVEFMDPQILFTSYITPESRMMFNRRIDTRVKLIAPTLDYDGDPYPVISDGKIYWIQDAYTTSDMYPYSKRAKKRFKGKVVNYIRNSVKVIIDAYNGTASFYVVDDTDPLIRAYMDIFPALFKPFEEMPDGLKAHVRYPRDLFSIQADTYRTYHMEDPQVFYNQEDLWQIPDELYGDRRQEMEPYYIIIKLPDQPKEEFLLMLPFSPSTKDNMIGWLAARSDLPEYGKLIVYKLPKEKLIYGPMQIEARVDQQTEISRELSLWDQRGSRVIRGNLLAIPISDSFIYVEPVYLEAKQEEKVEPAAGTTRTGPFGKGRKSSTPARRGIDRSRAASLPELKRVIVALGNRVLMEETLDRAIRGVLGEERGLVRPASIPGPRPEEYDARDLGASALEHYRRAKEFIREGNWAAYGKELEELERILKQIAEAKK